MRQSTLGGARPEETEKEVAPEPGECGPRGHLKAAVVTDGPW